MDNLIKYYYNLYMEDKSENDDFCFFKCNNKNYVFKKYNMNLDDTAFVVNFLARNNVDAHKILYNKDGEVITKYNNIDYVLMELSQNYIIDDLIIDIPVIYNREVSASSLWAKKVDYYMLNIKELGLNKKVLIDTFNYYVGFAENAISLYNDALKMEGDSYLVISHRRMKYPNYSINFLDPTNMVVDVKVRDIAEYIKYRIIFTDYTIDDIDYLFTKYNLNAKDANLLYARLFYPTYYFDVFEDNIISDEDKETLVKFYKKRTSLEKFLKDFYLKYYKVYNIPYVSWLFINQR